MFFCWLCETCVLTSQCYIWKLSLTHMQTKSESMFIHLSQNSSAFQGIQRMALSFNWDWSNLSKAHRSTSCYVTRLRISYGYMREKGVCVWSNCIQLDFFFNCWCLVDLNQNSGFLEIKVKCYFSLFKILTRERVISAVSNCLYVFFIITGSRFLSKYRGWHWKWDFTSIPAFADCKYTLTFLFTHWSLSP